MIDIACKNASRAGVLDTIRFTESDISEVLYENGACLITNPPYGKTWKDDQKKLLVGDGKKKQIVDSRFQIGIPRVSDGQLLFVEHLLSKMKTDTELGSRIASVHNGSALFTGDAGQGESEIRKYLFENDLVDAIVALPTNMFYNTGIPTYILILTNKKKENRKGKTQLINATSEEFYTNLRKTLGQKRVEISDAQIERIFEIYTKFEESKYSKIFDNTEFGYTQIKVHQPKKDENGNIIRKKTGGVEIDKDLDRIEMGILEAMEKRSSEKTERCPVGSRR
jgi:type I restriction enzyme M protein